MTATIPADISTYPRFEPGQGGSDSALRATSSSKVWPAAATVVSPGIPTKGELLERAEGAVERLLKGSEYVSPLAAMAALGLARAVLSDGSATPQVAPGENGSLSIAWMVDGDYLEMSADAGGTVAIYAERKDGVVAIEEDFDPWAPHVQPVKQKVRAFLTGMSSGVRFRAPVPNY